MKKNAQLRILLYKLYYLEDIQSFKGLTATELRQLKSEYTDEELSNIEKSLNWAIKHPGYDYVSLLPNLKFSNEEIYTYLIKMNDSFENYKWIQHTQQSQPQMHWDEKIIDIACDEFLRKFNARLLNYSVSFDEGETHFHVIFHPHEVINNVRGSPPCKPGFEVVIDKHNFSIITSHFMR